MFKPGNSTITRNMHKVSLWNYNATGLPHQRKQKCQRTCLQTRPTRPQARGFGRFSKSGQNLPLLWGEKKEQQFTSKHLHETGTRGGWGPRTCCFVGSHNTASMPPLCGKPTTHPLRPIFWLCKKPILNGNFPRKLHQSQVAPKDVIRN